MLYSLRYIVPSLLAAVTSSSVAFGADTKHPQKQGAPIAVARVERTAPVDFEKEVLPVLSGSCMACHNKTKAKAGLVLETPTDIRKGGDDGAVVIPGKGAQSLLLKAAAHAPDIDSPMPPPNNKVAAPDLTPEQLGLLQLWIDQGATGEVRGNLAPLTWQAMPAVLDPILAVAISGDGRFAACGRANRIDVYDLPGNKLAARMIDPQLSSSGNFASHRDMVESLAFSPDGAVLASGSYREVKLWRRSTTNEKHDLGDKTAACVAVSPDGSIIATAGEDGVIHLWEVAGGKAIGELTGHSSAVTAIRFNADGKRLLSGSKDKSIRIWDLVDRKEFSHAETPVEVNAVCWVSAGKQIAAGGSDGIIRLFKVPDAADGVLTLGKTELKGHQGAVTALEIIPDDPTHLMSGGEDGTIRRFSLESGNAAKQMNHGAPVAALAIRKDAKRLASVGKDGSAKLWTLDDAPKAVDLKGDRALAARSAAADRAMALAKAEITYRKAKLDAAEKQLKASEERAKKAAENLPITDKALEVAQKAFDAAKPLKEAAEKDMLSRKEAAAKALANAEDALKKAKTAKKTSADDAQKAQAAVTDAEKDLAAAKKAFKAATAARESAQKDDDKKEAAAREFSKAEEELKKAKDAAASAAETAETAKKAAASAEKAIADAQKAFDAAKAAKDTLETAKDEKSEAAGKEFAKAEDELKKSQGAKSAAEDEIKLSAKGSEESQKSLDAAKAAGKTAEDQAKSRETEAVDAKKALAEPAKAARAVAFSPEGTLLATAGEDGTVHTWSSDKGAPAEILGQPAGAIAAVAFAGDQLVMCPVSKPPAIFSSVLVWKLDRAIGGADSPSPFADRVTSIDFSPDGRWFVTGGGVPSRSGEIRLFDAATASLKQAFDDVHSDSVLAVRFSPDGTRLASASTDRFVRVLSLATGKVIFSLEGHTGHALGVAWSHDGHVLASCGADNSLRFWDAETGERGKVVLGFDKEVTSVCYVGDDTQVLGASGDGKVRLVKDNGSDVRGYAGPTDFVYSAAATADGAIIIAGGQDGILRAWDVASGALTASFGGPELPKKKQ